MAGPKFKTYQLVDAVNGSVVLVTQSLHALKAGGEHRGSSEQAGLKVKTLGFFILLPSGCLGFVSLRI